jgi:hypothetical protein
LGGAEGPEEVFLHVVEVWFKGHAGGGFFLGDVGGTEVDARYPVCKIDATYLWTGQGIREKGIYP